MLRLNVSDVDLDLYQDEAVNLTVQFSDLEGINSPVGSFSQTFRVPGTQKNMDVFGPVDMSDPGGVNLKTKKAAELFSGSVSILRGFVQVKAVYLQKKEYADIELVFFAGAVDLKAAVGDLLLSDLNLSTHDHILNAQNIQASFGSSGIAPEIRYGLIDKGFNWSDTNPPWSSTDGLEQGEFTPFIQAKVLFDAIMAGAGYTYDSTFFDTTGEGNFDRVYLPCYNGAISPESEGDEDNTIHVGINADRTGPTNVVTMPLRDDIDNARDASENFENNPNHRYTAPFTGLYSMLIRVPYAFTGTGQIEVWVYKNGSEYEQILDVSNPGGTTTGGQLTWTYDGDGIGHVGGPALFLETGDTLSIRYKLHSANVKIYGDIPNTSTSDVTSYYNTNLEIFNVVELSGQDVTISDNLPEMKQIDFVLGLQKMFNLVFVPDKNRENHLLIEPYIDYMTGGTDKAWNDLIDYDHDITLKPTSDVQAKRYEWTQTPGQDFVATAVQEQRGRVYGRYQVLEPDNDFATGDKVIEAPFAPYIVSLIPGTPFQIYRSINASGQRIENPKPMLAYYGGLTDNFGAYYVKADDGTTGSAATLFPYFSPFATDQPALADNQLQYGVERPFVPMATPPINTLFVKYWSQYVTELYSEEARIMTLHVKLDRVELAGFEFSDKIWMRGARWRVLKMTYDANVEGLVQVECLKVLSDIAFCEDVPTSHIAKVNYVLFNGSSSGSPDYGSQACCEAYGYNWVKNTTVINGVTPPNLCKPPNSEINPT